MKKFLLSAALLSSVASSTVLAEALRSYGALDYGTLSMSGPGSYSSPGALTISGGYRFLPNLAGEASLTLIGNATVNPPSAPAANVSQTLLSVVGVGTVPLNGQISLFGKAGMGLHNGDLNGLPDDLIFGFGGQVLLSEKLSVRLQYESLGRTKIPSTSTRADLTRLSVGATYDF